MPVIPIAIGTPDNQDSQALSTAFLNQTPDITDEHQIIIFQNGVSSSNLSFLLRLKGLFRSSTSWFILEPIITAPCGPELNSSAMGAKASKSSNLARSSLKRSCTSA